MELIQRRKKYTSRLCESEFFILKHVRSFVLESLQKYVTASSVVLDVGCGEQPFRNNIKQLGAKYASADVIQNSEGTVDYICPVTNLSSIAQTYDVIICTEVLEHVSDTYRAFAELTRTLRAGGVLILTTPFMYKLHEEPYDFVRLTIYQLETLAKEYGLNIISMQRAGNLIEVIALSLNFLIASPRQVLRYNLMRKMYDILIVMPVASIINITAVLITKWLGGAMKKKSYLNTMVVLKKA